MPGRPLGGARSGAVRPRGRGAPKSARGGDRWRGQAAAGDPAAMLGSPPPGVGGRARPRAGTGALPAHTCPCGLVAWGRSPAARASLVGRRRACVDTCVAGVAVAQRGAARLWCQARCGPVQRDREWSRPLSGAAAPAHAASARGVAPLQPAERSAPLGRRTGRWDGERRAIAWGRGAFTRGAWGQRRGLFACPERRPAVGTEGRTVQVASPGPPVRI